MKNKPILRYVLIELMFLGVWVFAFFVTPFLYPFRDKKLPFIFWMLLNDTTEGKDAGIYGRFKHNFWGFWRQCVFRNSHYNLKLWLAPQQGEETSAIGNPIFYNVNYPFRFGKQKYTYRVNGTHYFRYSFNKKWLWGMRCLNVQFGTSKERYIFKVRNVKFKKL
jgi:hypothetical protein